jgi:uncharacterized integral membrane protein
MNKLKFIFGILIIGLLGLIVYQNQELFLNTQSFRLNLFFTDEYQAPDLPNAVFFLACFLVGLLISYFFSLSERFKSKKMIKNLSASVDSHVKELSALKGEVESIKSGAASEKPDESEGPSKVQSA